MIDLKSICKVIILLVFMLCFSGLPIHAEDTGYLVQFKDNAVIPQGLKSVNSTHNIYYAENSELLSGAEEYIDIIEENTKFELIESIIPISLMSLPTDKYYYDQTELQMINADSPWDIETYGNEIRVAVIDTGCSPHDDINNNRLEGKNYFDNSTDTTDVVGHGTHVCGTIAAEMNDIGIAGVAPKAKIVPLKCFDQIDNKVVSNLDGIIAAIYDAVDKYNCQIINMSWGGDDNELIKNALNYASSKGVILIAAVGNSGYTTSLYPASYDNVIGVASIDENYTRSYFSQYNDSVFVSAPGEMIISINKNNYYEYRSGTSHSAPIVSGIAAIALSMNNTLTPTDFKQLLIDSSVDLGIKGDDVYYGYGVVNAENVVNKLLEEVNYYISPINYSNSKPYVLIKNNTSNTLNGMSIFSQYENGKYIKSKLLPITLLSGKKIILSHNADAKEVSHFLWGDFDDIKPLGIKR